MISTNLNSFIQVGIHALRNHSSDKLLALQLMNLRMGCNCPEHVGLRNL
jgi:hypothetical protein